MISRKMDFTLKTYIQLVKVLKKQGYTFQTLHDFVLKPEEKVVIMRHDIDRFPEDALKIAKLENNLGIKSTFFFRIKKSVFNSEIIKKITEFGHEIGYHYENLSVCKGDFNKAIKDFEYNLEIIRMFYPVKCICMHGNALKKWDNRDLWKKYNYKDFGIICEPYLDFDFNKILYLTDTGQRWDGNKFSLRDKTGNQTLSKKFVFKKTFEIIETLNRGLLPDKLNLNIHPERWQDNKFLWAFFAFEQFFKRNIKLVINKINNE